MKRILFFLICLVCLAQTALAQPATYGIPVGLGRNNCGSGGGTDSMYFFNYAAAGLSRASYPNAYRPRLKVGPTSTTDRWSIFQASISFNPKDQKLYYLWTDYSHNIRPTGTWTYIWRFKPDTTFATASSPGTANFLDTLRSFPYDIGGVAFDNNGIGWTLEFPLTNPCARAFFRPIDFAANIYNAADTLDFTSGPGGIGDTLWNPGSGDITMLPSGQIYYNFDNKLYTPDYGSYGGPTHHIKSTYIDTTKRPGGTSALVGLAFADGDLISSYATGCIYRRLDPVTGDTNYVNYTYGSNKGVYSVDMTQINSGIGSSKKLVSVTATGTANQYDVVYDVYVRNYGTVPVTNVQVSDNLGLINGAGNVSNVTAAFTSNPAGLSLNPLYNGTVVTNLLLGTQTLPNYPTANNNFTIRISCRLSNIQSGVVYNNQAVATAGGFNNTALRDSSTNGNNPDLNQNDKPDDVGESQPTPFVIILTPVTAPCTVLGNVLYTQDFGSGTGLKAAIPSSPNTASTTYIGSVTAPLPVNRFSITNNAVNGDGSNWISLTDHTGGANGNMMVVNADASASIFYRDTLPVACPGQQYSVSLWAAFIGNTSYQTTCNGLGGFKYPKFLIKIRDLTTGLVITQTTTADITSTSWTQYGMKFGLPAGYSNLILEIVNAGPGGCGNDVAIDDIQFGSCSAAPTANVSGAGGCLGTSTTFNSTLSDPTAISGTPVYQWQVATALAGPYTDIAGATSATYTIPSLAAADTGKYYRVIVASSGNIGIAGCQYISPGIKLNGLVPSTAPSSVTATASTICNSGSTTLTAVGAILGTGANYQWGTGAVVGTNPIVGATSSTLTVSPTSTTTYWVQVQNTTSPCSATTGGVTKVVTVNQPSVAPGSISGADFCNPGSTTLTVAGGALGTGANYQWGTGSVVGTNPIVGATASTLTVSPTSSTTYWVRIENGTAPCALTTGGVTKLVTVNQPSAAPASVSATASTLCGSGSVTLTAVGATLGTGANYQWGTGSVVGTNPIAGATSATLTVSPSSTTTYWVQVQNTTSPCAATTGGVTKVITVNQASVAPTSVTGLDFCNPGSTTLTVGGGTLGTGANYQWGTGAVIGTSPIVGATGSTLTVSPTSTTTYWVRIENGTAPCAITTSGVTKLVTVSQPSVAAATATKNKNNICPGISVNLGITGGTLGTGASWKWYTGSPGGTLVGTGSTLSVTPLVTTTYYVRAEGSCNTTTDQSVTVFISCDIDKDKDGITDFVESAMAAAFADANSNGVINAYDPTYAGFTDNNNDFINDNFQADGDSDNDGIPNYLDTTFPGRVDSNGDGVDDRFDADKDGIINMLDLDSDNDGIPDVVEAYGVDANGDGKIDGFSDTDGDGLSQNVDGNNTGAYNTGLGLGNIDLDGDGVPNFIDLDSDNDGIPDVVESAGADTNNDGKIDGFVDVNGDGLHDGYINASGLLKTGADINGDGKADSYPNKNLDQDLRPNAYDIDSDGDGIVDVIEAGLPDANLDGKADGVIGTNGWSGTVSAMAALNLRNTDGVANPDYLDIDADDDGIPDNIEGQSTAGYKIPVTTDTDGDGLVNTYDNVVGFGGSGIFVWDQDGDGIPDYRDLDTDGDGQPDIAEGNDFNLNGKADDLVTLTGLDTDGDGLDNRFDSLNSVTNLKGTSYMMGNSGSLVGDPAPGSRTTVQKKTPGQIDRDWRFVGSVLPVQFLGFTGSTLNTQVLLSWTILTTKEVDHFEIERSLDNTAYIKVGTVSDAVKLNEPQSFGSTDDIAGINSDIIYYRLKVVGKAGEIKYSNVLVVRKSLVKTPVAIMPNPANDYVSVKFFAEKESEVTIRLVDNLGKTVLIQKQRAGKGNNVLQLNNLAKYSAGVYTLQVFVNNEMVTHKLILER
ncbi:T9SS type A sorting domain-containing protein [Ferruginibacter profundus]